MRCTASRVACVVSIGVVVIGCGAARVRMNSFEVDYFRLSPRSDTEALPSIGLGELASPDPSDDGYEIGQAKTGAFNTPAPILSDEAPGRVVQRFLALGFERIGVELAAPEDADVTLTGEVVRFWVDEYTTGWNPEYSRASVSFDVLARDRSGKLIWAGRQEAHVKSSVSFTDASPYNQTTLEEAILIAIRTLFDDPVFWTSLESAAPVAQAKTSG